MFQVSICLTIYMAIMVLEIAPIGLERLNWQKPLRLIGMLTVLIAGAGIVLSSLHQSSLGSLFLLMPYKLHPLWWTPLLPLLFFASAAFAGLSMAIFVGSICKRVFRCGLDLSLLSNLARIVAVLLGFYLALKIADLIMAGELAMVFSEGWYSTLFLAEILIGIILPMVLFSRQRIRESSAGLIAGSGCVLLGLAINRTSVALVAQSAPSGAAYFPNWMELVVSAAAIAAGVLIFALAVRFLPILPGGRPRDAQGKPLGGWSRRAVALAGSGFILLTVLVVLFLQPLTRAEASRLQQGTTAPAAQAETCQSCHLDPQTLASHGAQNSQLDQLTIEAHSVDNPHGRLGCTICHYGDSEAPDKDSAHAGAVTDPSIGNAQVCIACHPDLPAEFPEDRLRTPHDAVIHGEASGVACSDCHGGVGHGFDPVSGEAFCPMGVCLDCHQTQQLNSELSDCDTCHIAAHDPAVAIDCSGCHQSTETWQQVEMTSHPLELTAGHAQATCSDCHPDTSFKQARGVTCNECHEPPGQAHYGPACEDCHTPASFQDAAVPVELHPVQLTGAHQNASCEGCHDGADEPAAENECSQCHERPEGHLSGDCTICHTPDGWASSTAAIVVSLSPRMTHGLKGQEDCQMCHSLDSPVRPAPSNHGDYANPQCTLCHGAE
jgi:formate-dependent nitrite reductase membrane component NrfD